MTTLPLPNNSAISADLSEEDVKYLVDASIDIDSSTDANNTDYEIDNIGIVSTLLASSIKDYIFENNYCYYKFHERYYYFPNNNPE
jgi:hypothetical protein